MRGPDLSLAVVHDGWREAPWTVTAVASWVEVWKCRARGAMEVPGHCARRTFAPLSSLLRVRRRR